MDAIFLQVLNMSLTASYVILFVLGARLFLKKVPKVFSYALWSVVLFRLVCPLSFEGLFSLVHVNTNPVPSGIIHSDIPQINTGIDFIDGAINPVMSTQTPIPGASINPMQIWVFAGRTIWLTGIAIMLIYSVVSLTRIRSKLVGAVRWHDNIYLADHITSPFVIGVRRPKIYLPSTLSQKEQEYVILHEQTHIRRFDHVAKVIAFLALTVHWFNPLVWLAFLLSVKDMEMSCDESVLSHVGADIRKEYSEALLNLATGKRIVAGVPLAFGEGETKGRLKNVLNYKKPEFRIMVVALVAVLAVIIGLAANPRNRNRDNFPASLLKQRTEYVGDNSKVGGIITALEYPENVEYASFELHTSAPPFSVTVNLNTDTETRNFYAKDLNEGPFLKNAIVMFSLIHNVENIRFVLNDGIDPHSIEFTRNAADSFVQGDVWAYSASLEQFETFMQMLESIEVAMPEAREQEAWEPQPEIKDLDAYFEAVGAARQSVKNKNEEIVVDDMDNYRATAHAWMEAWFDMFKALPKDNMAYISEGVVDSLNIIRISKEGSPRAFVFSVTFSVRPTYPIARNSFWMAGNTGPSPGRDETWGQMYREVELKLGDDGWYHFGEMGTGGVGHSENYDSVNADYTSIRFYITGAEAAAMTFAREAYGIFLINMPEESNHAVTAYEMMDFTQKTVSDGTVTAEFSFAVKPRHEVFYIRLNAQKGTGQYEGWLILRRIFTLEQDEEGYWRCVKLQDVYD
ncbi:MAG: M56 family metallopeptidase [Bacillota bacterium]|jgi:beta-lactamase regulating signal transducer with metallopeptidase domain